MNQEIDMFERKGHIGGAREGAADALADRPTRPRPNAAMAMAILSAGYMGAYFATYRAAHAEHRRIIDRRRVETAVREAMTRDFLEQMRHDQNSARAQDEIGHELG